jgi:hypothetical protein
LGWVVVGVRTISVTVQLDLVDQVQVGVIIFGGGEGKLDVVVGQFGGEGRSLLRIHHEFILFAFSGSSKGVLGGLL